jgi:hypothetical protein
MYQVILKKIWIMKFEINRQIFLIFVFPCVFVKEGTTRGGSRNGCYRNATFMRQEVWEPPSDPQWVQGKALLGTQGVKSRVASY